MVIALNSKNKMKIVNGDFVEPNSTSPIRALWERNNDMIISWILNTVVDQIGNYLNFINFVNKLWLELQEHYAQIDGHRIFQLTNDIVQLKQIGCTGEVYYHKLKGLWDEVDALEALYLCTCVCDCENGRENGERDQRKRLVHCKGLQYGEAIRETKRMIAPKAYNVSSFLYDILLVGNCQTLFTEIKSKLNKEFSIKDLGHLNYYLGIEFLRNSSGLTMSQRKYALDLLQQANVLNDKPFITPLNHAKSLNDTNGGPLFEQEATTYGTLVGKLIYLTITRLDLSFAAKLLSQFSHASRTPHQKALLRVIHYIKLCPGQGLYFLMKNSLQMLACCDSD
nr:cysteine-rich RLK (receptor-like protein kinase) 8 [Tanacetum cinerariifolium]